MSLVKSRKAGWVGVDGGGIGDNIKIIRKGSADEKLRKSY